LCDQRFWNIVEHFTFIFGLERGWSAAREVAKTRRVPVGRSYTGFAREATIAWTGVDEMLY